MNYSCKRSHLHGMFFMVLLDWQICLFVKFQRSHSVTTIGYQCFLSIRVIIQMNQVKFFSLTEVPTVKIPGIPFNKQNHYKGLGLTPRTGGSPVRNHLLVKSSSHCVESWKNVNYPGKATEGIWKEIISSNQFKDCIVIPLLDDSMHFSYTLC